MHSWQDVFVDKTLTEEEATESLKATQKFVKSFDQRFKHVDVNDETPEKIASIQPMVEANLVQKLLLSTDYYLRVTNPDRSHLSTGKKVGLFCQGNTEKEREIAIHYQRKLQGLDDEQAISLIFPDLTSGILQTHGLREIYYTHLKKYFNVETNLGIAKKISSDRYSAEQIEDYLERFTKKYMAAMAVTMYGPTTVPDCTQMAFEELACSCLKNKMNQLTY